MNETTATMTKRYSILQGKLGELESDLNSVLSLSSSSTNAPCHELLSRCLDPRFAFLRNLLDTELASNPNTSWQLHHIARRLAELEHVFRRWNNDDGNNVSNDNPMDSEAGRADNADVLECSCAELWLNDDENGYGGGGGHDKGTMAVDDWNSLIDEEAAESDEAVEGEEEPKRERIETDPENCEIRPRERAWRVSRVGGVLLGLVLTGMAIMVKFWSEGGVFLRSVDGRDVFQVNPT